MRPNTFIVSVCLLMWASVGTGQVPTEPFGTAGPTDSPAIQRLIDDIDDRGNEAVLDFWNRVKESGAPLVEPVPTDRESSFVTFLWHGEPDTKNVAVIDGVAVGVGDADPSRSLMRLLPRSDVWYRTYVIRNDARFHYWLSPNDSLESLEALQRNSKPKPDPLNPRRMAIGPTYLELSNAPVSAETIERDDVPKGDVAEVEFHSNILGNDRKLWVYTPPMATLGSTDGSSYPLLIAFDGAAYRSLVPVPTILDNLIHDGVVAPMVAVLMTHADRDLELGASADFVRFLADELVPWARRTYHASDDPSQVVVAGSSRGGLAATYAALERPDVFGKVLAQSPSLWWSPVGDEEGWVPRQYENSNRLPIVFYLEDGHMEASIQRRPIARMRDILQRKGYELEFREFNGNHTYLAWRQTFAPALTYLMAKSRASRDP